MCSVIGSIVNKVIYEYILMSLKNHRSIVRVGFPRSFSSNLVSMISRCNWFFGLAFLTAAFSALLNPPPYIAIALLFFIIGLIQLPVIDKSSDNYWNWQTRDGIRRTIVLTSLVVVCLIVPQVETNTAIFTKPIDCLESDYRHS